MKKSLYVNRWVVYAAIILAIFLADRFLRSRYDKDRYIDPDDVRMVTVPAFWEYTCEVYADKEPELVRRLIVALNRGRSRGPSRLRLNSELVIIRWREQPILITFGQTRDGGPMMFRDSSYGRRRSVNLYRSPALQKALEAIRDSGRCQIKPPRIPSQSVKRVLLYGGDAPRELPVSSPRLSPLLTVANSYLETVNTSSFGLREEDKMGRSFHRGAIDPYAHLMGKTGAIFVLDPPLSMHTTFSSLEYHEFTTNTVIVWQEPSTPVRALVGFNSDEIPGQFYVFYCFPESSSNHPWDVRSSKRWKALMQEIEECSASFKAPVR